MSEATAALSGILTILLLVLDGSFEVECFDQGGLMQHQRVAHTVDVNAVCRHPDAQLCRTNAVRQQDHQHKWIVTVNVAESRHGLKTSLTRHRMCFYLDVP